jgi:hypothetical protein
MFHVAFNMTHVAGHSGCKTGSANIIQLPLMRFYFIQMTLQDVIMTLKVA